MFARAALLWTLAARAAAAASGDVSHFTLDNGLEVVVIEDRRAPVVTHMLWYKVGAADEVQGQSGIAHFLEHLMFDATDDVAAGEFSRIVRENGGSDNAFTSSDFTGYFQRVAADRLGLMMRLEADRMRDLLLDGAEIERERAVVLEERTSRIDRDPEAVFAEQMQAALYLNHPYGRPIIGWRHEIEALTRDRIAAFYRAYYAPDNAVLVVTGDVGPAEVRALAEEHYGPLAPSAGLPPRARPSEPPHSAERRMRLDDPRVGRPLVTRSYLAGWRRPGDQQEAAALTVLAVLLGGGRTAALKRQLVDVEGVALDAGAWYDGLGLGPQSFTVYVAPAEGVTPEAAEARLDAALAAFVADGPDEARLDRIKAQIRAGEVYALDSQRGRANRYGMALTTGLTMADIDAWPRLLEAVTPDDVRRAAEAVLDRRRAVTGILTRGEGAQ